MMTEGRFSSLPRSLHHQPASSSSSSSSSSSWRLQTSMDLLTSRTGLSPGPGTNLSELTAASYHPVSIHGTLPRRRRGGASGSPAPGHYTWEPGANHTQPAVPSSPLAHRVLDGLHAYREPPTGLDPTVDYVKFSRDQFIMDGPPEKLRRELEEELKMHCDQPQSHAWYHGAIPRQVAENLVQRDGDFLVRDSLSSPGSYVLTCQWRNTAQHFKINKKVVSLNEAYSREEYQLDREGFHSVPALIRYYVGNRKPVSQVVGAIIFQPINRGLPLRCLAEKYGLAGSHREAGLTLPERRSQKRLSLNILNGQTCDATPTNEHAMLRDNQLRLKDRCGSQPASLNQVQERRRPLKTHQSESFLPLGAYPPDQSQYQDAHLLFNPRSPVFRTGSEPVLSPSVSRRTIESQGGQAIRGSDSQLCPKPPPKPSKVPSMRLPRSPCPLPPHSTYTTPVSSSSPACPPALPVGSSCPDMPSGVWRSGGSTAPPVPPVKPLKFQPHLQTMSSDCPSLGNVATPPGDITTRTANHSPGSPQEWEGPDLSDHTPKPSRSHAHRADLPPHSYVERLRREESGGGGREEGGGGREEEKEERGGGGRRREGLDRSSYHHAIAALENTSEEEEEEGGTKEDKGEKEEERRRREEERRRSFRCPVVEMVSAFCPSEFGSRLLHWENKPLETIVLKRVKELLLKHSPQSIARHLLLTDCQVARIMGVSSEVKGQMGVASGLELVTLPHGRQLRLDLMERHHTMAIGVAVDILGCTSSVEERASTLNRIIMVAMELKDTVGDLYAFTALMKALEMPQITRLEQTWTALRRSFTQTAVCYEKKLKPFCTQLYEGTASLPPVVCVPLLLPLLSLMERPPSFSPGGVELWEGGEQGCDVMLRHLEAARGVAGCCTHTENTHTLLQGFHGDPELLEVFQTDFQLRLLWGSRGASVNQSDRYNKFTLILTALSRKLEPPRTHTTTQI